METPLRAIEMSDSSSLGINPSLAAEVHDACVPLCMLAILLHLLCAYAYVCIWVRNSFIEFFFNLFISLRSTFWGTVTELWRNFCTASWQKKHSAEVCCGFLPRAGNSQCCIQEKLVFLLYDVGCFVYCWFSSSCAVLFNLLAVFLNEIKII